jgi:hypothetical protein
MQLVWVGFAAFFVVSLAVGVRLVALAARTQQAPELLIGISVLGIGPIGFGLLTLAPLAGSLGLGELLAATGACAIACGIWAKLSFNWLVYRRQSSAARLLAGGLAAGVAAYLLAHPLLGSFLEATRDLRLSAVRGSLQSVALSWGSIEAFVYWARLRRRARLGLADAVLVNRFFMWATAAGAAGLGTATGVAASLAIGRDPLQIPGVVISASLHGFVAAVAMWLAFAPPRAYARWIAAGAARV